MPYGQGYALLCETTLNGIKSIWQSDEVLSYLNKCLILLERRTINSVMETNRFP